MDYIKKNYDEILGNIKKSVEKSNNDFSDITLIAVTKNVEIDKMAYAKELGIKDFGENKVQEFLRKYDYFGDSVNWHLIGHLQKNKVKYVVGKVEYIHSVDSVELLEEINKRAKKIGVVQKVLLQVNIANDEKKFGIQRCDVEEFFEVVAKMDNVQFCGFMTIIPFTENSELRRSYFYELYKTSIDNLATIVHNVDKIKLSMGMTNDYQEAIESNSNMVRIGTGLFGERIYLEE